MADIERVHLARPALLRRLPDDGAPGSTSIRPGHAEPALADERVVPEARERLLALGAASSTGSVLFTSAAGIMLVLPPFPVDAADDFSEIRLEPLVELLNRKRALAVLLLRLGGFSLGFFRGEALVDSKTDQRFVKNRHRKGGQSQRRFERIREKQIAELFGKVCETAREKLEPYEREIEHMVFGGDRRTLLDFRKHCSYFERYGERVMERVLPVPGDPRRSSLEAIPREVWSSDVYAVPTMP